MIGAMSILTHDGHGASGGLLHYLLEPEHAVPIVVGVVCLVAWWARVRRSRARAEGPLET